MDLGLGYGTDYYGYRKKFAVLVPSTNTTVEYEYNRMAPAGVVVATRGCVIPPFHVTNEDEFVGMVKAIGAATEQGLRDSLTLKPDHVIFGYSAETFWDGKERSDREFARYNAIAQEIAGCNITFGAQAIQDALACYPGVHRIGVVSPYMPIGNTMVEKFMSDIGYEVVRMAGHSSPGPVEIAHEPFAQEPRAGAPGRRRRRRPDPAGRHQPRLRPARGQARARARQARARDQRAHLLARAAHQRHHRPRERLRLAARGVLTPACRRPRGREAGFSPCA